MRPPLPAGRATPWDGAGIAGETLVATAAGPCRLDALGPGARLAGPGGDWQVGRLQRHVFAPGSLRWSGHPPPVRIEAGALGGGLPRRPLLLGAAQPVLLDGQAWPARWLVTGTTIRFQPEGAPCSLVRLWPAAGAPPASVLAAGLACATADRPPGPADRDLAGLALLRQRLQRLAGQQPGALHGHLDRADHDGVVGWAHDPANPGAPVCLELLLGGQVVAVLIADRHRQDLGRACGFAWQPPCAWPRDAGLLLSLRRGDAVLPGCPVLLPGVAADPALLDRAIGLLSAEALAGRIAAAGSALLASRRFAD